MSHHGQSEFIWIRMAAHKSGTSWHFAVRTTQAHLLWHTKSRSVRVRVKKERLQTNWPANELRRLHALNNPFIWRRRREKPTLYFMGSDAPLHLLLYYLVWRWRHHNHFFCSLVLGRGRLGRYSLAVSAGVYLAGIDSRWYLIKYNCLRKQRQFLWSLYSV